MSAIDHLCSLVASTGKTPEQIADVKKTFVTVANTLHIPADYLAHEALYICEMLKVTPAMIETLSDIPGKSK